MKRRKASAANVGNATAEIASTEAAQEIFPPSTAQEIERQRAAWVKKQRADHLKFVKQFSFHNSTTFMDYLHGDVDEEEAELACRYEYTRELKAVWEAAKRRDEVRDKGPAGCEAEEWNKLSAAERNKKAALWVFEGSELQGQTFFLFETLHFLVCESFPKKDWNELSQEDRKQMTRLYRKKVPPLPMKDVWTLRALGVFDEFKAMGDAAKPVIEDVPPGQKAKPMAFVPPILQQHESCYHAIFDLDFSKGATQLVNEFREWLRLSENHERLERYKKPTIGATDKPLNRLKDLAAWRLYRELGNDWEAANEFANEHRRRFTAPRIREKYNTKEGRGKYHPGDLRPFRDAKPKTERQANGKSVVIPANQADLFGEQADAYEAQASAWKYLAEFSPREFAPPGPDMLAVFVELEKLASKS